MLRKRAALYTAAASSSLVKKERYWMLFSPEIDVWRICLPPPSIIFNKVFLLSVWFLFISHLCDLLYSNLGSFTNLLFRLELSVISCLMIASFHLRYSNCFIFYLYVLSVNKTWFPIILIFMERDFSWHIVNYMNVQILNLSPFPCFVFMNPCLN